MKSWWVYKIQAPLCRRCGLCFRICPSKAIMKPENGPLQIDQNACSSCGTCMEMCKLRAIRKSLRVFS